MNKDKHVPVLYEEVMRSLNLKSGDIALDCTAGFGGHLSGLLSAVKPRGLVVANDRDPYAFEYLEKQFGKQLETKELILVNTKFSKLKTVLDQCNLKDRLSAILADLGVSSPQLDRGERGFSLKLAGPLDMRMNPKEQLLTAEELLSQASEQELRRIMREFGEEPKAFYIAKAIVKARQKQPIKTTRQLSQLVEDNVHYKTKSKKHPATRVFQALRIAVNQELDELKMFLAYIFDYLKPGGKLAIISFHSLEDRIVKQTFNSFAGRNKYQYNKLPITELELIRLKNIKAKILKPYPIEPSAQEIKNNPRARSAKLRIIEKL